MRIATLANASVIHTQRWVAYFRERGHDVALWSLESGPDTSGARRLTAPPGPGFLRYPLATLPLRDQLERFAPHVVDAHYVPSYGLMGAIIGRHPLSVSAWGSDLLVLGRRGVLQRARARFVLRRADLVLADAENLAAAARALGAPSERVACIPWGISLERFRFGAERRTGLILSTRMMEPVYDLPTVIAGLAPVLARHPEAELVLAGDGGQRSAIEAMAAARLPAGRYRFVGRLAPDSLADWLARADLYVSASRSDSTSLSLLEAMASGAVPVVSDIEGNREWVGDGSGARLFAAGEAAALERAVEAAWADPGWRERTRLHNREVVESRADQSRNMARIEARFEALKEGVR